MFKISPEFGLPFIVLCLFLNHANSASAKPETSSGEWESFFAGREEYLSNSGLERAFGEKRVVSVPWRKPQNEGWFDAHQESADTRVLGQAHLTPDLLTGPNDIPHQAEIHGMRHPLNPLRLVTTFQDGRFTDGAAQTCGYAWSDNGGVSWTRALVPGLGTVNGGLYDRATDPVVAFDHEGRAFFGNLALNDNNSVGFLTMSRSDDGGVTFQNPIQVYTPDNPAVEFPDKNWIAANPFPNSPTAGRIAFTYSALFSQSIEIRVFISDDQGSTWSNPVALTPGNTSNQGSQAAFLPDGSLVVLYHRFGTDLNGREAFIVRVSPDGGITWEGERIVERYRQYNDPNIRNGSFLPAMVADGTGVLHLTYSETSGFGSRIRYRQSTDGGRTWVSTTAPVPNPDGVGQIIPAIGVSSEGTQVTILYYEKTSAEDFELSPVYTMDVMSVTSLDGGASWQTPVQLTSTPFDMRNGQQSFGRDGSFRGYMLGDYQAVAGAEGFSHPAVGFWVGTYPGQADPYTTRVAAIPEESRWILPEATTLGGGWSWSPWLGFHWIEALPWVYHNDYGWLYGLGQDDSGFWLYEFNLSRWVWTYNGLFPSFVSADDLSVGTFGQ